MLARGRTTRPASDHGNWRLYLRREHAGPGHQADLEPGAAAARPHGGDRAGRSGRPGGVRHRRASPAGFPGVGAADAAGGRGRAHQDYPAVERGDGALAPTIRCGSISNMPRSICCPAAAPRSWPAAARSSKAFRCSATTSTTTTSCSPRSSSCWLTIRDNERVTWQGQHRAPLHDQRVYPAHAEQIPIWVAVGGNPPSAIRAGTLGLPMALAIIGGMPERFAPFVDLFRDAAKKAGHDADKLPVGLNTHGYVAETSQAAADEFFPSYAAQMTHIGRERGWPPTTRAQFDARIASSRASRRRLPRAGDRENPLSAPGARPSALSHADERRHHAARPDHALDRAVRNEGRARGAEGAENDLGLGPIAALDQSLRLV